jgi:hypothetical protein
LPGSRFFPRIVLLRKKLKHERILSKGSPGPFNDGAETLKTISI